MGVPELGRIKEVDVREIWPDEARDFTPWLAKNLDLLSETLEMDLEAVEPEALVGRRRLDILAKDQAGQTVVIENQLEATDHNHLARLLIYAAGYEARIVTWVAAGFTDEHLAAMDWLNARTREEVDFYGVEVRVVKIGDSCPAPDFRLVARPNTWSRQTRRTASPEKEKRRRFNQKILDRLREQGLTDAIRSVDWNSIPSEVTGFYYFWGMVRKTCRPVAVYLEMKTGNREHEKKIFDSLNSEKGGIEASLGGELLWKESGNIQIMLLGPEASIDDSFDTLDEIGNWIVEHLRKLKQVFDPRLQEILGQSPLEKG